MEDSRRCKAHKSDGSGERCLKAAMLGQSVCRAHGGASPQAKKSARARLEALVDPAISGLGHVIRQGQKKGDLGAVTRASVAVLDRCGFSPDSMKRIEDADSVLSSVLGVPVDQLPSADGDTEAIAPSILSAMQGLTSKER